MILNLVFVMNLDGFMFKSIYRSRVFTTPMGSLKKYQPIWSATANIYIYKYIYMSEELYYIDGYID